MKEQELRDALDEAKRFAREHLAECAGELIEWSDTARLRDGRVRELARLLTKINQTDSLTLAENCVKRASIEQSAAGAAQPSAAEGAKGEPEGAVTEHLRCVLDLTREALAGVIQDAEATYNAAQSGKPIEISIGQFRRLEEAKTRLGSAAPASSASEEQFNVHPDFEKYLPEFEKLWAMHTATSDLKNLAFFYYRHGCVSDREAECSGKSRCDWHPDFIVATYENQSDRLYTMDQMREYADAFHRSRIEAGGDEAIYQTGWERPPNQWGDVPKDAYDDYRSFGYTRRRIVYTRPAPMDARGDGAILWQARNIRDQRQTSKWHEVESAQWAKHTYDRPGHVDEHGYEVRPMFTRPAPANKAFGLTEQVLAQAVKTWFPDRAYQAPFFARSLLASYEQPSAEAMTDDARRTLNDAITLIAEAADSIKAGCAIDNEWPDAEYKAEYDQQVDVLDRLRALLAAAPADAKK